MMVFPVYRKDEFREFLKFQYLHARDMKRYYGIQNLPTRSRATSISNIPYGYLLLV